jgi:hypothetical protein
MDRDPDRDPSVTDADRAVARAAQGFEPVIEITSAGQLEAMARAAQNTFSVFHDTVVAIMTPERAAFVRDLRVGKSYSWRAVADACFTEWETTLPAEVRDNWQPRSNQIMGMALCEVVAAMEGQHFMKRGEWN